MILLIASSTCPNCKFVERLLNEKKITYNVSFADIEPETAIQYNVKKAPTLLVIDDSGAVINRYENASEIKGFIEQ